MGVDFLVVLELIQVLRGSLQPANEIGITSIDASLGTIFLHKLFGRQLVHVMPALELLP